MPFCFSWAQSTDVAELTIEATSKNFGNSARQEIFDNATEQAAMKYVLELIGEQKAEKYHSVIKNKIIKQSSKYVLYLKGGTPERTDQGTKMSVQLKININSLAALLRDEGLLYQMTGPPRVLPVINISDRVNSQAFSWWEGSGLSGSTSIRDLTRDLHLQLRRSAREKGFFVLEPIEGQYKELIPEAFLTVNAATEDLLFLGEYFSAQMLFRGAISVSPRADRVDAYRIEVRLSAIHTSNARVVGEVIRSYDTDSGAYAQVVPQKLNEVFERVSNDLTVQVHETWKSGTFGASSIQLAVLGSLDYQQMVQFRSLLLSQFKDIRTLKERLFSPGKLVFEVDTETKTKALSEKFSKVNFAKFRVEVEDVQQDKLSIRVKPI